MIMQTIKRVASTRVGLVLSIGLVSIAALLTIIIMISNVSIHTDDGKDVSNWFSMIIEVGIGIIVAFAIFAYDMKNKEESKRQQEQLSEQTFEIQKLMKVVHNTFNERQLRLVSLIRSQMCNLKDHSQQVMRSLDLWVDEEEDDTKEIRKNNLTRNLNSLKIYVDQSALDEIKTVGNRHLSATYQPLLTTCNLGSTYYNLTDHFEDEMVICYRRVVDQAIEVINALQKYVDKNELSG